jgi:ribonucleoside-diphosphate reductase alpha chain
MTRERLPDTRRSITHKAVIRWGKKRVKFYITVGLYPRKDGEDIKERPGEVFLTFDEAGSMLDGWADAWSTAVSMCLQHGETLANLVDKFGRQRFDPQGMTENEAMPFVSSVVDYVVRWMDREFGEQEQKTGG